MPSRSPPDPPQHHWEVSTVVIINSTIVIFGDRPDLNRYRAWYRRLFLVARLPKNHDNDIIITGNTPFNNCALVPKGELMPDQSFQERQLGCSPSNERVAAQIFNMECLVKITIMLVITCFVTNFQWNFLSSV